MVALLISCPREIIIAFSGQGMAQVGLIMGRKKEADSRKAEKNSINVSKFLKNL